MTQVIAAVHPRGIVVATDGRGTRLDKNGPDRTLRVKKLFPLGAHAFVLSAGSGLGIPLTQRFQAFVQMRGHYQTEKILRMAGPFLSRHYGVVLSQSAYNPQDDPLGRLLFLIGGLSQEDRQIPYRLVLLASEGGRLPLEEHGVAGCLTIPRSLGAEIQLQGMCENRSPLEEILDFARHFLLRRAAEEEGVGPPYYWGVVTHEGLKLGEWAGEETVQRPWKEDP